MRILFVHDHVLKKNKNNYYSSGGIGDEKIHSKYCIDIDDELYLYTRYIDSNNVDNLVKIPNKNVKCIPSFFYKSPLDYFFKYKKISNEIKVEDYDTFILRVPSMLSLIIYKKIKNKKNYYVEVVGCPWDALRYRSFFGKILAPFLYIKTKKIIKNAKCAQYVTNSFLQKRYPTKNKSIGCSDVIINVEDNNLHCRLKKIENKKKNDKIVVCTIGNADISYKGQKYVIKAISKLKKRGYDIDYFLIGSGTGNKLKKISEKFGVTENIKFLGQLEHDNVIDKLKKDIDIYIQPSNVEGLCRSLIEAMGCGLPCIASNVGGNPELVDRKYLFRKKNVDEICELCIKFIDSKKEQKQASISNFNKAKEFDNNKLKQKRNIFYFEYIRNEKNGCDLKCLKK